jgi:hypothetical protein
MSILLSSNPTSDNIVFTSSMLGRSGFAVRRETIEERCVKGYRIQGGEAARPTKHACRIKIHTGKRGVPEHKFRDNEVHQGGVDVTLQVHSGDDVFLGEALNLKQGVKGVRFN